MAHLSKSEYKKLAEKKSPNSPIVRDVCMAFLIGGLICAIGQGINDIYHILFGLSKEVSSNATSITLIFIGALLTGLNIYGKIAKHAGAGTIVPITGFSNAIVAPALEHKSEGYILGTAVKMFSIAGPVLVFGVFSSVICGIIVFALHMY